jgi:hypothetical protein
MKRAIQATDHLILRAVTKSSWDDCNFALLHITPEWELIMSRRLMALQPFKSDFDFYCHTYWDAPLGYYSCKEESDIGQLLQNMEQHHDSWAFVELDDPAEPEGLTMTESDLDTHMMMINADGGAFFMCFGKHTGEEYSTEGFSLTRILKKHIAG